MKTIFGKSAAERLTASLLLACATLFVASIARADDTPEAKPPDSAAPAPEAAPAGSDTSAPASPAPAAAPSGSEASAPAPATQDSGSATAPRNYGTDPVTGAPLGPSGDRQAVHAITHPGSSLGGRFEIAITMPVQINPQFTQTVGNGLELQYHLADPIGIVLGGTYYWESYPTVFTDHDLAINASQAPIPSDSISAQWEAHLAIEFQPIYAKMAFTSVGTLRFGFYVDAGVAVAGTVIELEPPSTGVQRTTGSTGIVPAGFFSTGFRFYIGDHFAIRLELRDLMFSAYANTIRGCDQTDLNTIGNGGPAPATCQTFNNATGKTDAHIADGLLTEISSSLINDFQFAAAISVVF